MNHANKRAVPFVVMVGDEELNSNLYTLKEMSTGEQSKLTLEDLVAKLKA
jgi:histidyl-tRNA synthetase